LDNEIKSWLAFAAQKIVEVNALAKALAGQKDEVNSVPFISSYNRQNEFLNKDMIFIS